VKRQKVELKWEIGMRPSTSSDEAKWEKKEGEKVKTEVGMRNGEKIERSDTTNLQYSIYNIQFRLVRVGHSYYY
jgi:hypothetical protein